MSNILEEISNALVDCSVAEVRTKVQKAVDDGVDAQSILNKGLLVGMDEVWQLFKDGEMFVPEVLVAAKAMQIGVEIIKPQLLSAGIRSKARFLMVTVEGDLHDIGIKLVGMMLEGAGFEVINIGVDVKPSVIVEKVKELRPDVLGMSAMLTTTMTNMKNVMDALREEGALENMKVMVGGAPLSSIFAEKIGAIYSSDANEAVVVAKKLFSVG